MTFAFVSNSVKHGGLETLAVRMSSWLLQRGHQVVFIAQSDGPARSFFDGRVSWVILNKDFELLKWRGKNYARRVCQDHLGNYRIDVLIALNPPGLWVAGALLNGLGYPASLLAGVWTPRTYSQTGLKGLLKDPTSYFFRTQLPAECRLFMSQEIKTEVEKAARTPVNGFIWPLAVDGSRYSGLQRKPSKGHIVSIGRIEDMKTYNWHSISITQDLLDRGYDVEWNIYGDGLEKNAVQQHINASGLQDHIRLRGSVDYHRLSEVLVPAQVFVGMGTSLIEAGFCRVPGVCAIPWNESPTSHGYLHEMPGYACGERLNLPLLKISDLIARLLDLSPAEYALVAGKTGEHVQRYDLNRLMPEFMDHVARMPKMKTVWRPGWIYLAGKLVMQIWAGPLGFPIRVWRRIRF